MNIRKGVEMVEDDGHTGVEYGLGNKKESKGYDNCFVSPCERLAAEF